MARKLRLVVPQFPHHVVVRGNNRRRLFSFAGDYMRFLWDLRYAVQCTGCLLHGITLMCNHAHLLVTPPDAPSLPRFVKRFSQRYAQYRNARRRATGKLFEQRFFSVPILDDRQLAITTVYADLNALRGGLVDDPVDYRWSTYALHAGDPARSKIPRSLWTPSPWYEGLGKSVEDRAAKYREWVASCRARDLKPARVTEIEAIEALSSEPYGLRLQRPDGSGAAEPITYYDMRK
jgi:putative transposase